MRSESGLVAVLFVFIMEMAMKFNLAMTMYVIALVVFYNVANLVYVTYKMRKDMKRKKEEVLLYGSGGGGSGEEGG